MTGSIRNRSDLEHAKLQRYLYPVAKRLQRTNRLERRLRAVRSALLIAFLLAFGSLLSQAIAGVAVWVGFLALAVLIIRSWQDEKRLSLDYLAAAQAVEARFPQLQQALLTAVQQQLSGDESFFADRNASLALASPTLAEWSSVGQHAENKKRALYAGGLLATFALQLACVLIYTSADLHPNGWNTGLVDASVTVEPGNSEVESGSSLVVTARFAKDLPATATLSLQNEQGQTVEHDMARSLSDPVFAYTLRDIKEPFRYQIRFANGQTDAYQITTYQLPKLLKADASLDYPDYTGWEDAAIGDTLRVSAIEGTELTYRFTSVEPVASAALESQDGERIALQAEAGHQNRFLLTRTLHQDERYKLHLTDAAGRKNAYPPEITLKVIPNLRPNLRLQAPSGDQRLSLLEEFNIEGTATDDFGLLDYGIGLVVAAQTQNDISLYRSADSEPPLKGELTYQVLLEEYGLAPKDTLNWFLWAIDYGPDGQPRRTTGDLFFADIRSFDERFREQDQGGSGQGGGSGQSVELIERQRRISISLFRIKDSATDSLSAVEDLDVMQRSQQEAMNDLQALMENLQEPIARQHAQQAMLHMHGVYENLETAMDDLAGRPLETAWREAQGAYDRLIKLSDDEYRVSRSQNAGGSSGSPQNSRNQAQINQLDFRQQDSRYETASQAEQLGSPEGRQNLELISKLNELSQRQDDLNQRLQELQSDLAQARSDGERQAIERELKRLEEEQRQMLADADEAIQQTGNRQSSRQAREQLEQARENMRRASEQIGEGQVSQALASGTRARSTLENTREQLREANSSQFAETMRQSRAEAQRLAEQQQQLEQELDAYTETGRRSLDDSEQRDAIAEKIEQQSEEVNTLLDSLQEIAEAAENVEPGLYRDLYQVLRDANGERLDERYEDSARLLSQGFIREARREQRGLANTLGELSEEVTRAAQGILGSEEATFEFAQAELDSLNRQLQRELEEPAKASESSNGSSGEPQSASEAFFSGLEQFAEPNGGPLTGTGYGEWVERLRTVESLIEDPQIREQISTAREFAESMRRDFKRHGALPKFEVVVDEIANPLTRASSWVSQELNRIKNPDALQAIDRDPIPEAYSSAVNRYYESLGEEAKE